MARENPGRRLGSGSNDVQCVHLFDPGVWLTSSICDVFEFKLIENPKGQSCLCSLVVCVRLGVRTPRSLPPLYLALFLFLAFSFSLALSRSFCSFPLCLSLSLSLSLSFSLKSVVTLLTSASAVVFKQTVNQCSLQLPTFSLMRSSKLKACGSEHTCSKSAK